MIRILDSFIADKIAAGEVIEKPVSAVKELIENSIDAGASSVIVEIRGGGASYIRITDDGCGISFDEIETAFQRHATSKITNVSDLDNIQSLFTEQVCRLLCAVAAENDEAVETKLVIILLHGLDLVESVRIRYAHELERLAGRADDRAAACQNAREISSSQQAVIAVNEPLVAVLKAVNLKVLDIVAQSFDDAAHRCVQCLAVAPACQ